MSVSIECVAVQLQGLASGMRRRLTSDQIAFYHRVIDKNVEHERDFVAAVTWWAENEGKFPSPADLIRMAKDSKRGRGGPGKPWIVSYSRTPVAPLEEWIRQIEYGEEVTLGVLAHTTPVPAPRPHRNGPEPTPSSPRGSGGLQRVLDGTAARQPGED